MVGVWAAVLKGSKHPNLAASSPAATASDAMPGSAATGNLPGAIVSYLGA